MLRRTLTALTPALLALPLLLTPTSQLYADADMDTSVYSGLECKYLDSHAMEGQMMAGGDVVYHTRLGIGNNAPASQPGAGEVSAEDAEYLMSVACPLPSLEMDAEVRVAVIDGTVFDDVTCWIQSCRAGIGLGSNGQGGCTGSYMEGKSTNYKRQAPYTQSGNYITQNVDWLNLMAPMPPEIGTGLGREVPEAGLGMHASSLICTLPERDDISPEAPAIRDGDSMPLTEEGISYIQSYYVM